MDLKFSLEEIHSVAKKFIEANADKKVFALHGEMGAGKTTFVHAVCKVSGVKDTVSSPTFSIINQYITENGIFFHIDLYRLKDEEEAMQAGVEDTLYSGSTCFVEWPEKAPSLFPAGTVHVKISVTADGLRKIEWG